MISRKGGSILAEFGHFGNVPYVTSETDGSTDFRNGVPGAVS